MSIDSLIGAWAGWAGKVSLPTPFDSADPTGNSRNDERLIIRTTLPGELSLARVFLADYIPRVHFPPGS